MATEPVTLVATEPVAVADVQRADDARASVNLGEVEFTPGGDHGQAVS